MSPDLYQHRVGKIVEKNSVLDAFWKSAQGWAPPKAAELLSSSRLDRQVSLSHCLGYWKGPFSPELVEGALILGWANLGSLVEGTLKLFLAVYYADYMNDPESPRHKGKLRPPDTLTLEQIRQFLFKRGLISSNRNAFILKVQQRRNAIHSFKDRPVGDENEFYSAIGTYLELLNEIDDGLPYP